MRYHPMTLYSSHRLLQLGDLLLLLLLFLFTASGNITMERGASQEIGFQVVKSSKFHSFHVPIRCWSGWYPDLNGPSQGSLSDAVLWRVKSMVILRETHSASCLMLLSHRLLRKSLGAIPSNLKGIQVLSCSEFRAWEIFEPCNYALHLTEASVSKDGIEMLQDC